VPSFGGPAAQGERGRELAIFRSKDRGTTWDKLHSWGKVRHRVTGRTMDGLRGRPKFRPYRRIPRAAVQAALTPPGGGRVISIEGSQLVLLNSGRTVTSIYRRRLERIFAHRRIRHFRLLSHGCS